MNTFRTDIIWCHLMSSNAIWCHPVSLDVICCHLLSSVVICCHLLSSVVIWCHLLSSVVIWCYYCKILLVWNFLVNLVESLGSCRGVFPPKNVLSLSLGSWWRKCIVKLLWGIKWGGYIFTPIWQEAWKYWRFSLLDLIQSYKQTFLLGISLLF